MQVSDWVEYFSNNFDIENLEEFTRINKEKADDIRVEIFDGPEGTSVPGWLEFYEKNEFHWESRGNPFTFLTRALDNAESMLEFIAIAKGEGLSFKTTETYFENTGEVAQGPGKDGWVDMELNGDFIKEQFRIALFECTGSRTSSYDDTNTIYATPYSGFSMIPDVIALQEAKKAQTTNAEITK